MIVWQVEPVSNNDPLTQIPSFTSEILCDVNVLSCTGNSSAEALTDAGGSRVRRVISGVES